jgi:hypothetical protein
MNESPSPSFRDLMQARRQAGSSIGRQATGHRQHSVTRASSPSQNENPILVPSVIFRK